MRLVARAAMVAALLFGLPSPVLARKAPPAPPPTSSLIDNVNGLAVDGEGRIVRFNGLLIDKDGKVERRLQPSDTRPASLIFRMDAQGKTLIPGFVDAHAHVIDTGLTLMTLDLSDCASLAEAQAVIAAYVRDNPGRKWILGRGWDAARWGLSHPPGPVELDSATGDIPAWLLSREGEQGWANSAALKTANAITAPRQKPLSPEEVQRRLRTVVPVPAPKDRDIALDKAQKLLLAAGYSLVTDMGIGIEDWQSYRRMGDRGALRLRIAAYASGIEQMVAIAGPEPSPWLYGERLRMAGVHFALDGSLGARRAWLSAPYADAPTITGSSAIAATPLRNQMSRAAMDGFQIAVTAHGDAAISEAIAAFDEMAATYKGDRRWRIIGADLLPADLQAQAAARGIVLSADPAALARNWRLWDARLGTERAANVLPLADLARASRPLSLGSAAPAGRPQPFRAIALAMTREDQAGEPFGGWNAQQRLSFELAFAAVTRAGAQAAFAERLTGALEPGQAADFLLIDRDISVASPRDIAATKVLENWIGGKAAYVRASAR